MSETAVETNIEIRLRGAGASRGIGAGPVVPIRTEVDVEIPEPPDPKAAVRDAAATVAASLRLLADEAAAQDRAEGAEVLRAQALMAEDDMLIDGIDEALDDGAPLGDAVIASSSTLSNMLAGMDDEYLAARAPDVLEVAGRLRRVLAGLPPDEELVLDRPSVLLAETLTAAHTARLDPRLVIGFATADGGPTSHVAIIARALGVPAVVGVTGLGAHLASVSTAALDGITGELILDPSPETSAEFGVRAETDAARRLAEQEYQGRRVAFDGTPIAVTANVASTDDIDRAAGVAADGVGLFRTEFLFLDRPTAPSEDEQYEAYAAAARSFTGQVVIRTADIGGDKPAEFFEMEPEENPFLGIRGVRLYESQHEMFLGQARALLRASVHGDVAVMIPMIATVAEMRAARAVFDRAAAELVAEGVPHDAVSIGAMVEVPAAALAADALAAHCDFFSIGTNDLTQYTMAADRMNGELADLHDPLHPAVLRLCQLTAEAAARHGLGVSVCGLAAADPAAAALFVGLGVTKLSVAAPSVNQIKAVVDGLPSDIRELAASAMALDGAAEVRAHVADALGL